MSVFLAFLLIAVSFAGCKDKPTESDSSKAEPITYNWDSDPVLSKEYDFSGTTVKIASPYATNLTPGESEAGDRLIERIEKIKSKFGITVKYEQIDAGNYWDNMATVAMSGQPFGDLMFAFPWMITGWIKGGVVRDAAPIAKALNMDLHDESWNKLVVDENTYGNAVYGFARGNAQIQMAMLYNKRLLQADGLTDPNELTTNKGWNFAKLEEYAKKLTKFDSAGAATQWGVSTSAPTELMISLIQNNGGKVVDLSASTPKFTMDEPKSLAALDVYTRMLNTDKTLNCSYDWQTGADAFANGMVGFYLCEEWVLEYIRDVMTENGSAEDFALTYFPLGPDGSDYVDSSYGGNSYFIPSSISEKQAQAALLVYYALYAPIDGMTLEESATATAEGLFSDETSVGVYVDIVANKRAKSSGICKVELRELVTTACGYYIDDMGTPQSIIDEIRAEAQGLIEDSAFVSVLKKQQ